MQCYKPSIILDRVFIVFITIFSFFILNNSVYSCSIYLCENYIYNEFINNDIVKRTDCSDTMIDRFVRSYNNGQKISQFPIKGKFNIKSINDILKNDQENDKFILNENICINTKIEKVSYRPNNKKPGNKTLLLSMPNRKISKRLELEKRIRIFKINGDLTSFEELKKEYFTSKFIYTSEPDKYVNQLNDIHFYRLRNNFKKDKVLLKSDLVSKNIISPGDIVTVIYKNNNLLLKSKAISKSYGKINQLITIQNIRNNKLTKGKVINNNQVELIL